MNHVILFGFKGCGKTYWGQRLAKELDYQFVDTDRLLEALYTEQYGDQHTCAEIYKIRGKEVFRQLEHVALLCLQQKQKSIVALGGGAVLDPRNLRVLRPLGRLVYLKIQPDALRQRLLMQPVPAFFDAADFNEAFDKHYEERRPIYERIPAHVIELDHKNDQEILNQLYEVLDGK